MGGFVPFPLTSLPWDPSLWGLVSPLCIQRSSSLGTPLPRATQPSPHGGCCPLPPGVRLLPAEETGEWPGGPPTMACPAGHRFLLSRDALRHPHRGGASSPPVPPGKLSARNGDFGKLCRRPEKSLHPRQMPPVSLTCLLLPEPLPPHLRLHTAPVTTSQPCVQGRALREPHACPHLPSPLAGLLLRPSLPLTACCPAPAGGPGWPHHRTWGSPSPTSCDLSPCFLQDIWAPLALHPSQDPVPPSLCAPLWLQP